MSKPWILITGPTASGKTALAVEVCRALEGEVISADSRQVYRGMTIGTGKDLTEYSKGGAPVPYHLIDIRNPGEKYHVHAFREDFKKAVATVERQNHIPVICGGTGLYLEAILEDHTYMAVPVNETLRNTLEKEARETLITRYEVKPPLPFSVDLDSKKRIIRAIEIQEYLNLHPAPAASGSAAPDCCCFLLDIPREVRRQRISKRLHERLSGGLIEEVEELLTQVKEDDLIYYGLEYKYVTEYLSGKLSREELNSKLETEIHRYAKRQMTWFRRMEKRGTTLHRINGLLSLHEQKFQVLEAYHKYH
jgi:tRNA dimethylallyltransferase